MRRLVALLFAVGCGGSNGADAVFINEVMPSNTAACADPFGEFDDWIELYNTGSEDLDLGGYSLSDDPLVPMKGPIAAGVVVPAGGFTLLWLDDQVQGLDHFAFKLDAQGEQIALYAPDGAEVDSLTFGEATTDVSFARAPDATGDFISCSTPTCGASNGTSCTGAR